MRINELTINEGENWSKHNHKRAGGMSDKSVSVYRREHPGSHIQTAVTKSPSKIKKGSKDAKRRASFCARMRGMKKHRTSAKTANDPNSNINKSLRRWHCESIEQLQELVMIAEQKITEKKRTQAQRNSEKCWPGKHKEGMKNSPAHPGMRVNNCVPNESVEEAANLARQAATAINMKKNHKKPKHASDSK